MSQVKEIASVLDREIVQKDLTVEELERFSECLADYQTILFERIDRKKQKQTDDQARKREQRKQLRDELIPVWCRENLKPGMIVKVKGSSQYRYRIVESVSNYKITGRHCTYFRYRKSEPGESVFVYEQKMGNYITDHLFTNIQSVKTGHKDNGEPIMENIMDLVEKDAHVD